MESSIKHDLVGKVVIKSDRFVSFNVRVMSWYSFKWAVGMAADIVVD